MLQKTTHTGLTVDPASDTPTLAISFDDIQASGGFSYTRLRTDFTVGGITPTNLIITIQHLLIIRFLYQFLHVLN